MFKNPSKITVYFWTTLSLVLVGFIDYFTGTEVRVFPLYYIPLLFVTNHLGKTAALLFSLLASIVWVLAMQFAGRVYSQPYVWVVNFFTQGVAFAIVSMVYANLKAALQREQIYSRTDLLTGLLNSRSFHEKSAAMLSLCNRNILPITLAYIDLDNFKYANDTLGHSHGDKLLTIVSSIFKNNLRACDLIARLGGDEFAILLPTESIGGAYSALEKIRKLIEESPELSKINVTASIGGVTCTSFPKDLEILIKTSDELMYKVKKKGKNHVLVEEI